MSRKFQEPIITVHAGHYMVLMERILYSLNTFKSENSIFLAHCRVYLIHLIVSWGGSEVLAKNSEGQYRRECECPPSQMKP